MNKSATLFLTAFVQVLLVALNTYQIAKGKILGSILVGFLISLVWTYNVKRAAFSTNTDRVIYAAGAALGTAAGLLIGKFFYK